MGEFDGHIKKELEYKEWKNQAKPILKEYNEELVNRNFYNFLKVMLVLFFLVLLLIGGTFLYLTYDGKMISTIQNTIYPNFNNNVSISYQSTSNAVIPINQTLTNYINVDKLIIYMNQTQ